MNALRGRGRFAFLAVKQNMDSEQNALHEMGNAPPTRSRTATHGERSAVHTLSWRIDQRRAKPWGSERDIEIALGLELESQGHIVERQARCKAGLADIVTEDSVFEIKGRLNKNEIFTAIGQLLLYNQCFKRPHLVIIGRPSSALRLLEQVQALDIEVALIKSDSTKMIVEWI